MNRRPTVADLRALKGVRQLLTMHVDNVEEALAASEVGIDMVNCEVDEKLPPIRAAAPRAFVTSGYPHGHIVSAESAIREGFHAIELGTDTLYFDGSLKIVEAMAREGIPVTGHVGLIPGWSTWTNYRAIGKTTEEAVGLYHRLKAYEDAGAWSVELECVPGRGRRFPDPVDDADHARDGKRTSLRHAVPVFVRRSWHQQGPLSPPREEVRRFRP